MAAKKTKQKPESGANDPREYEVIKKFRLFGMYHPKGAILTLKPSQASYFVTTQKLQLKGAK